MTLQVESKTILIRKPKVSKLSQLKRLFRKISCIGKSNLRQKKSVSFNEVVQVINETGTSSIRKIKDEDFKPQQFIIWFREFIEEGELKVKIPENSCCDRKMERNF
jgi:hypothetical protein